MARMASKLNRPIACPYGCCDQAYGFGRRLARRTRAKERQAMRRSFRRTFWAF